MNKKSIAAAVMLMTLVNPSASFNAEEIKLDSTMDEYVVGSGIEFSLDYTSNISVPESTNMTKQYLFENGYVDYTGYITSSGSEANSNLFVSSDTYSRLNLNDYNPNQAGTYTLSIDFVDGQDSDGLHYSTATFDVTVEGEVNPGDIDPLTPTIDAEGGKLNRLANDYTVQSGIEFSLGYTSEITVAQNTEITKEFLFENGYVDYIGYITATGAPANSNLFVSNDTYSSLNLNDYNPNQTGTYTLSVDFVDGQDEAGLHYSTASFDVIVEATDKPEEIDTLTPTVDVESGKLNRVANDYIVGSGIEFSLAYTSDITVDLNTEITKEYLFNNGYVDYSGYITTTGAQANSNLFVADNTYSMLNLNDYNPNQTGTYSLSIDFVDGQDSDGLHYSTASFNVHVK